MPPCRLIKNTLLLAGVCLLSGCATTTRPVYNSLPVGTILQLNQAFESIENGTQLQFQHGRRIAPGNLDRWHPYCLLYIYDHTRGPEHRIDLFPGDFEIFAVQLDSRSSDYPFFPDRGYFGGLSWGVRDAPAYYMYRVAMGVQSADQPELRSLDCYQKWATPRAQKYPTPSEIREALGKHFSLIEP